MGGILGIDLGTTNTVGAILDGKYVKIIKNEEGERITPSVVAFLERGGVITGSLAKRQLLTNPERTITSIKRIIGKKYPEIEKYLKDFHYKIVRGPADQPRIAIGKKTYSPEEIQAHILRKIRKSAEKIKGGIIKEAVITVPAYFNEAERQATKNAGKIAGLNVHRIISEPTAAALAYGLDQKKDGIIAVYDFGGGTFDISILEVSGGMIKVLSTHGNTRLGGDDLDHRLMYYLNEEFKHKEGIDLIANPQTFVRLKEACEKAKIELSSLKETEIHIPFITVVNGEPKHLYRMLTRKQFEAMISDIVDRTINSCRKALFDAKLKPYDVSDVVLVGGSTKIPLVRRRVSQFFMKEPKNSIQPDEIVAIGAAIQGGIISGRLKKINFQDVIPLSIGIETQGGIFTRIIPRNSPIPIEVKKIFSTAKDNQKSVGIHVLQGESEIASKNFSIGKFVLKDIPDAPRGEPKIEVAFRVDADGLINVRAREINSGKSKEVIIKSRSGLSSEELNSIIKNFEKQKAEDKKLREIRETKNLLTDLIFKLERKIKEGEGVDEWIPVVEQAKVACEKEKIDKMKHFINMILEILERNPE